MGETSGTDSYVYSYDAGGNLVSVQKNGEVIKSYTYGDASWKDLLTAFNGQSIKQMKAKENECRNRDFVCKAQ